MKRELPAALLAALLALALAGCGREGTKLPTGPAGGEDLRDPSLASRGGETPPWEDVDTSAFQKNMHQSRNGDLRDICETREGYYLNCDLGPGLKFRLYYLDKATQRVAVLCGKPDCGHSDPDACDALVDALGLWTDGERLYYTRSERGGGKRVFSEALNGTGRREVMDLGAAAYDRPIFHRGEVYFVSGGVLYAVKPGGDLTDARRIWGRDYTSDGPTGGYGAYDPSEPHYTLWADGDALYFMVNVPQEDGTQRDTLFSCPLEGGEAERVWATPDREDVGEWETTGVSVSQWYVANGSIYFYLSGGDFWKTDLTTGETVKLADTHEKTQYGSAVFSDDYLCLLNDRPMANPFDGTLLVGVPLHEGGDTVFVYDLEGTLLRELSLEKLGPVNGFTLLLCDGENLYFNVDAGHMSDPVNGVSQKVQNNILCCVNIDTGEITEIYNWQ